MDDKRKKAITNNEALYASVFRAHGIELEENEAIYYSLKKAPPLNSNLCTKSPSWIPDKVFTEIREHATTEKWDSWSIKDSFSCLNLTPYGFERLFDAEWLYLSSASFNAKEGDHLSFEQVHTKEGLSRWIEIWGEDTSLYTEAMLTDPTLFFVIGHGSKEMHAALLNRSDDVMGISNFFPQEQRAEKWSDLIGYIQNTWGPIDIVGYERSDVLESIAELGVERVGDLRIWITRT